MILSLILFHAHTVSAAFRTDSPNSVDLRYGNHKEYVRVVIEGPDDVISRGKVKHAESEVSVTFADMDLRVKNKKLPISYSIDKNRLFFRKRNLEKIEVRTLANPSRLVIDFYERKTEKEQAHTSQVKKMTEQLKNIKAMPEKKKGQKTAGPESTNKKEVKTAKTMPEKNPSETMNEKEDTNKINTNEIKHDTEPKQISTAGEEKTAVLKDDRSLKEYDKVDKSNIRDFVPPQYKKLWTLLESGNNYGLLTVLPEYKPEDAQSVAIYHYMYGAASYGAKQYFDAIEHLRLAYIYASHPAVKEKSLSMRARSYMDAGFYQEARADYMMLINNFPSSKRIRKAHLGLANSLSMLGLYSKAIAEYDKAGQGAIVLYSKANALQRLERVKEAETMYVKAKLADETYLDRSPETYFLLGENMRMSGNLSAAEKHLSKITTGEYKDSARISLGLIALKKGKVNEAFSHFSSASLAKNRKIKISGLFNLALAQVSAGKIKEATQSLETIRHDHVDSYVYKDTLLALSKIYRKEHEIRKSLSLLKELVYGKHPPQEAFVELEKIILESGKDDDGQQKDKMSVSDIWKEVGQWLIDEKRESFLVDVSDKLRNNGLLFLELSSWLVKNASQETKAVAALNLADYYADIGEISLAKIYIAMAVNKKIPDDDVLRTEVKILNASGKRKLAIDKLVQMRNIQDRDIEMLGNIIFNIRNPESATVKKGIEFYEKVVSKSDWNAEVYTRLADLMDASGRTSDAIKYYRIAHEKNPEDEWTMYRIGRWSTGDESEKMYSQLQDNESLLGRVAKTELTGMNILNKIHEVY
ncbi:MAG: tetratricopeptide repeat protein [Nitrospiraceae bacterium]|nr:MAG: tetratricopeptide repeat protein [Nitrospiraceae bacterium]